MEGRNRDIRWKWQDRRTAVQLDPAARVLEWFEDPSSRERCQLCGRKRIVIYNSTKQESVCPRGHAWFWCEAHGRRVTGMPDPVRPCGDHGQFP
jgi:hypothetical protein